MRQSPSLSPSLGCAGLPAPAHDKKEHNKEIGGWHDFRNTVGVRQSSTVSFLFYKTNKALFSKQQCLLLSI